MTIIRFSSVFVIVLMATKMVVFTTEDAGVFETQWFAELEHEVDELIDESVRYRAERREVVERGLSFALALRRATVQYGTKWMQEIRRHLVAAFQRHTDTGVIPAAGCFGQSHGPASGKQTKWEPSLALSNPVGAGDSLNPLLA